MLAYGYRQLDDGDAAEKFAAAGNAGMPLNAWLKIDPAGTITCAIHRAEMGQGIVTTLAMLLAEELDANWADIAFEFAPVDRDYYNFGMLLNGQPLGDPASGWAAATGTWAIRQVFHALGMSMTISSSSTIDAWDTLRPAGATARQMLLQAAGRQWAINPNELVTRAGYVIDPATDRRLSYGALAEAAARERPPGNVRLKDPADYTLIGTNVARLDTPLKVTGRARFGADIDLPGMRYAVIKHSPQSGLDRGRIHDQRGRDDGGRAEYRQGGYRRPGKSRGSCRGRHMAGPAGRGTDPHRCATGSRSTGRQRYAGG